MHAWDARAKIVVLLVYTVAVFLVETWLGMAAMLAAPCIALAVAHVPARALAAPLRATAMLTVLAVVFGTFTWDVAADSAQMPAILPEALCGQNAAGLLSAAGFDASAVPSAAIAGSFGVTFAGFARGCFIALRIVALVLGSLVVSLTTSSTALTAAFSSLMSPLCRFRVPTDDAAMALFIAVRFIPVLFDEMVRIRDAQWSRGAPLGEGGPVTRVRAWSCVLVPLFVGLFRRADALAFAMDARCYGTPSVRRTSLAARSFAVRDACAMAIGAAACIAVAVLL